MDDSQEFLVRDHRMPGHFWADNEVFDVFGPQLGEHGFSAYMVQCRHATNGTRECRISTRKLARRDNERREATKAGKPRPRCNFR